MKEYFEFLKSHVLQSLQPQEHVFLNLFAESSQFVRINGAKVRQMGTVDELLFQTTLLLGSSEGELRKGTHRIHLTKQPKHDIDEIDSVLVQLRQDVRQLPIDPFAQLPKNGGASSHEKKGSLIPIDETPDHLLREVKGIDIVGLYAAGTIYRGMANSAGQFHWFSTENFIFDYSLYARNKKAVKGSFAGAHWSQNEYIHDIQSSMTKLPILEKIPKKVERGGYRTYLAPAAFGDLIQMLSWGGVSEASIQQGDSPLRLLRSGQKSLSPLFSLTEDFTSGEVPLFNAEGDLAPQTLPLIQKGKLINTWVSSRSAREYQAISNGAELDERLRSPRVGCGGLKESQILENIETGLYLSNLHYLNWSDQPGGRITGMTRYACFWVEDGKLTAPIENLRFDDTVFHLLGERLLALTDELTYLPETSTYGMRSLGGQRIPGALLSEMSFTL